MEVGEREIIYLSLHCHHQNDSCIKMDSDESHFNVSVGSDGQSHKTVSTNHNLFEEKGKPKRYRTEVLPLTGLNALPLGQTGSPAIGFWHKVYSDDSLGQLGHRPVSCTFLFSASEGNSRSLSKLQALGFLFLFFATSFLQPLPYLFTP